MTERKPEPIRNGYGKGLLRVGRADERVVALDADLAESTRSIWFGNEFPDRFFQMGISEQDMVGTAAGLAAAGKIPFASTFAIFSERAFEQVRNAVARPNLNVKIVGSHGGMLTGQDGSSAQCIEDLAIYRALPNMVVLCPSDVVEAEMATVAMHEHVGPMYMRTTRDKAPILHAEDEPFVIGRGEVLREGEDVSLCATGPMVARAMEAADHLEAQGISALVANFPTLKPMDAGLVETLSRRTGLLVTCEDHNIIGGLGGAIAETLVETRPCRMARIGMPDRFGESGAPEDLYKKFGLTGQAVAARTQELLGRRAAV